MVVPFPAGGGTTLLARILAEAIKEKLGQPMIVETVPGAGGSIGVAKVARAAADGYTLSFGNWASHVGSGAVYPVDYDLLKDFEPIAHVADAPLWLVARKDFPANNLKDAIAWLKANPGKATAATVGVGSGSHLCGIYVQNATGVRFQFIPYKGGAPASQDLISGNVDLMCDFASNSLPFYRSGQIKALAVMAKQRWFGAPQVPTVDEMGVPGIYVDFWHGLWAPKGTPKDIIAKLNSAVVDVLADDTVRKRFADQGQEIPPRDQQTPAALHAFQQADIEKWWPMIKAADIKAEN
jgi:tripartite-type tricarboxylate transporter receptor subunit TctC